MRILHVASSYPLDEGDATAPFMEEIASAQVRRGHDVAVLVPAVPGLVTGRRLGVDVSAARYAPRPLQVFGFGRSLDGSGAATMRARVPTG